MKVYHGTIDRYAANIQRYGIDLYHSKLYLDFGKGFYTTSNYDFAMNTAKYKAFRNNSYSKNTPARPSIIVFEYCESSAAALKTMSFPEPSVEWCKFVIANRLSNDQIRLNLHHNFDAKYDIVSGVTADGASGVLENLVVDVQSGIISIENIDFTLIAPACSSDWGDQISFHTPKSFTCIQYKERIIL